MDDEQFKTAYREINIIRKKYRCYCKDALKSINRTSKMLKNYIQDYATLKKQIEYIVKKKQYIGPDDVTRMMYFSSSEFADLVAQNTRALEKGLADLQNDFKKLKYSEHKFMEHAANGSHQIVIVASSLDLSTERIVNYLNKMDIAVYCTGKLS